EIVEVYAAVPALAGDHRHASRLERSDALHWRSLRDRHHDPRGVAGADQSRLDRQTGGAVDDHAQRLARPGGIEPHRELRVVGDRRADPDHDPIALGAQAMASPARLLARDPSRTPVERSDLAVERHRALERDVRAMSLHRREEWAVGGTGLRLETSDDDLEPGHLERSSAAADDPR